MTTCLGKGCSFGQMFMSFVGVFQILCVSSFPFGTEGLMSDVIVFIPDHCLSIYFSASVTNSDVRHITNRLKFDPLF